MVSSKLFIILLFIKFSLAIEVLELSCTFSRYMLNYFEHNERYLLQLINNKENINEHNLKMYGEAIQSHNEIVLAMIKALKNMDKNLKLKDLFAINLYLNNISGSVEFIAKNENGKFDGKHYLERKLDAFIMFHKIMKNYLRNSLVACVNVAYDTAFVSCPNFNKSDTYDIETLQYTTKLLKYRLLNSTDVKDNLSLLKEQGKLIDSEVVKLLRLATLKKKHFIYHPRYMLFYELMSHQQEHLERDVMIGTQMRQHYKNNNNKPTQYLDFIRYAKLHLKCPNNSLLTISDIFRYMKYNFRPIDVEGFQELVIASTFRPLAILTHYYVAFLKKVTAIFRYFHGPIDKLTFFNTLVTMGPEILTHYHNFLILELYPQAAKTNLATILEQMKYILEEFQNCVFSHEFFNISYKIMAFIQRFMDVNRFSYILGTISITAQSADTINITVDNVDSIMEQLVNIYEQVTMFSSALPIYEDLFKNVLNSRNFFDLTFAKYTRVLFEIGDLKNKLCCEDIYSEMEESNDSVVQKGNIDKISVESDKNTNYIVKDLTENHDKNNNFCYITDYVLPY
ncbi:uncharacterized protein LOC126907185 [Daktulosphaira vitifoliae]|uniref:uncharacterized protein LOC126907185 n=1 Tax=Daktulosphaira vitifoliae TaxID=58002 RepID=UPI0021AA1CB8|nr:uncharacterized protein LOC126907185 [Daktulosphaira vitifoliae]